MGSFVVVDAVVVDAVVVMVVIVISVPVPIGLRKDVSKDYVVVCENLSRLSPHRCPLPRAGHVVEDRCQ